MTKQILFLIIVGISIIAFLFAWLFYQKAKYRERMHLIEKGVDLDDVLKFQKKNKIKLIFPWFKLSIMIIGLSVAFLGIAFLVRYLENDLELFKGFLISFIIGTCMGISLLIIHFINKADKANNGG
tara:strand:- start:936 stop:1313 length:378 start_codon:yes stop_codon:yes gene_type:complete